MSPYDAVEDAMVSVVKHLSLTGRLLYPIVDKFIVHWPELREQYPRSRLVSSFISHPSEVLIPVKKTLTKTMKMDPKRRGGLGKSQCLVAGDAAAICSWALSWILWCSANTKTMSRSHRLRQAKFGFDRANHSTEYPRLSKVSNPS